MSEDGNRCRSLVCRGHVESAQSCRASNFQRSTSLHFQLCQGLASFHGATASLPDNANFVCRSCHALNCSVRKLHIGIIRHKGLHIYPV